MADIEKLKALAEAAGGKTWAWWTSCSFRRLTIHGERDGGALSASVCADGVATIDGTEAAREFIEAASPAAVLELIAEVERLREKAEKFGHVERAMEALRCNEREGGIVTAASLVLISSAHNLNAARGVIDQEGVTFDDESIGDWRVTIERIKESARD